MTGLRIPAFLTTAVAAACLAIPATGAEQPGGNGSRRDLLLPVVLDSRQGRALGTLVRRPRRRAGSVDPVLPDARPVLVGQREGRPRADAGDRATGVGTLVVSWWGFDSPENERLLLVEQAATRYGLEVAIHVEPYRGRTAARAAEDIEKLRSEGGSTDFYVYDMIRSRLRRAEALGSLSDVAYRHRHSSGATRPVTTASAKKGDNWWLVTIAPKTTNPATKRPIRVSGVVGARRGPTVSALTCFD